MEMERTSNSSRDRLSSLPRTIISFLPLTSSVVTSALSHRWRHRWTETTSIILCQMGFDLTVGTVHHILSQLTSPKIRILALWYRFRTPEEVYPFFDHVCHRNVEVIRFGVRDRDNPFILNMPAWIFECDSLVILELKRTEVNLNEVLNHRFFLPKLKSLDLKPVDDAGNLMGSLLKSCPLLEDLSLCTMMDENLTDISSSILKSLTLTILCLSGLKYMINAPELESLKLVVVSDSSSKFKINAPKLKFIDIYDENISTYQFSQYPAELVLAQFRLPHVGEDDHGAATARMSELFRVVSNSNCLAFSGSAFSYIPNGVVFHNPKCAVEINGLDHWSTLFLFVQFFPNLESLNLFAFPDLESTPPSLPLSATVSPPPKLLSKLKYVTIVWEWKLYNCDPRMIKYILRNAPVLEKLVVVTELEKSKEVEFCKAGFVL